MRIARLALAVLALASTSAAAAPEKDQRAFADAYVAWLRKASPGAKAEVVGPLHVRFEPKGGHPMDSFLDNAWRDYEQSPEELEEILARHGRTALEAAKTSSTGLEVDRVVPVIKHRDWAEASRRSLAASGVKDAHRATPVTEDYNGLLVIAYAEDHEQGIAYVTDEQLAKAKVARSELRALALKNLRRLVPQIQVRGEKGVYMIVAGGNYEASILLSDKLWPDLAGKVSGDLVVAVPARDLLLVTGSRDPEGLARVRQISHEVFADGNYAITEQLLIWRDGKFVAWDGKR